MKTPLRLFAVLPLWLLSTAPPIHADPPARPDLTGRAVDGSGAALANVRVLILAAGPRKGNSPLCPFNYPDCGKESVTDADGNFRLPSLDPAMDFCIAALAPDFEPDIQSKLLPEAGPVNLKLRARDLSAAVPARHVAARIIGPDGAPVAGAMIDVEGVEKGDSTQWGGNSTTDGLTVTDANGEFHLLGRKDFTAVRVRLNASGLAPRWARLEPGKTCLLRMRAGATVQGRLLKDGQPLRGVVLGLCTEERECGKYISGLEAATDDSGRFEFRHVPAGLKFQLFGKMDSTRAQGVSCQREFVSAPDDGANDLGDWRAAPACRVAGRVILADGKPVPANTRIMLDRAAAWDTTLAPLDAQGGFALAGVPAEKVSLYVGVPGYHLSAKNPSLELDNRRSLIGRVGGDVAALNILLEPGNGPNWGDMDRPSYEEQQKAEEKPLRGVD